MGRPSEYALAIITIIAMASLDIYIRDLLESKDDTYSVTYDCRLRSHIQLAHGFEFANLPYVRRKNIYAAASATHSTFEYLRAQIGGPQYTAVDKQFLLKIHDLVRSISDLKARNVVWNVVREQNLAARMAASPGLNQENKKLIDGSIKWQDSETCVRMFSSPLHRPLQRDNTGENGVLRLSQWMGRTSRTRCCGINARWGGRISQTTVGGFGGGGLPRSHRSDALTDAVVKKRIRFNAPAGLAAAAAVVAAKKPEETPAVAKKDESTPWAVTVPEQPPDEKRWLEEQWEKMGIRAPWDTISDDEKLTSVQRYTFSTTRRKRKGNVTTPRQPPRHRHAAAKTSRSGVDARRTSHQTPENLDLVWSVETAEWHTTSSSSISSDKDSVWSTSEDEVQRTEDHKARNANKAENDIKEEELSKMGDERDAQPDDWPLPDHRYTHLGPGRGRATRHLAAVSQLGFAGGGLLRERSSNVLPSMNAAGAGSVGRVIPVPGSLAAAAAASAKGDAAKEETKEEVEKGIEKAEKTPKANSGNAWLELQVKGLPAASESNGTRSRRSTMKRSELILSVALIVLAILYIRELQSKQTA